MISKHLENVMMYVCVFVCMYVASNMTVGELPMKIFLYLDQICL